MREHIPQSLMLLVTACAVGSGCGGGDGARSETEQQTAQELAEFEKPRAAPPTGSKTADKEPRPKSILQLDLTEGERFPLRKTVKQTLFQSLPDGPVTSHSHLDLLLALTVDQVRENGRALLSVHFEEVRYEHEVGAEKVVYDSRRPTAHVPPPAQTYDGLLGNQFSFWIDAEGQVGELVGFRSFLRRSLQGVPEGERRRLLGRLEQLSAGEVVAKFVDAGIGLIPGPQTSPEAAPQGKGDSWVRSRSVLHTIPLSVKDECTLTELSGDVARIEIRGTIVPERATDAEEESGDVTVTVRKGYTFGSCSLHRRSGIPVESRLEYYLDMVARGSGDKEFEQQKRTVVTVRPVEHSGPVAGNDEKRLSQRSQPARR